MNLSVSTGLAVYRDGASVDQLLDAAGLRSAGRRGGHDHRLTERPERQARQPNHQHGQRQLPNQRRTLSIRPGRRLSSWFKTVCPAHAPTTWPPTTAASWMVQMIEVGRRCRLPEAQVAGQQVVAALERIVEREDDALPIDEQVRQVVRDEIADGDRQQAGADANGPSAAAPRPARAAMIAPGTRRP